MHWQDDWPVIGVDIDRNGIGEPVKVWTKPLPLSSPVSDKGEKADKKSVPVIPAKGYSPFTLDGKNLAPQWQWNHNPADEAWSLTEHKDQLTLHALQADNFRQARNTLTQKVVGYESEVTVTIDCSHLAEGGRAGLACIGKPNVVSGIRKQDGRLCLYCGGDNEEKEVAIIGSRKICLRLSFDMPNKQYRFAYSTDGKKFTAVGEPFFSDFANWKGVRFGLFHYNKERSAGYVCIPWVKYEIKK